VITTGNDEIIGFVLEKSGGNGQSFNVVADLTGSGGKRDAAFSGTTPENEETVAVATAATTVAHQTAPPYSLYRVSFDGSGNVTRQLIAEDIFRMRFRYFDKNGVELAASGLGSADAQREARKQIRRIELQLTGMTRNPDLSYVDPKVYSPSAAASARQHRKVTLTQQISALNLGKKWLDHGAIPVTGLTAPPELTLCTGHCNKFLLSWPAVSGVSAYKVRAISAGSPAIDTTTEVPGSTQLIWEPPDPSRAYTFTVASWNTSTNEMSAFANPVAGACANSNTPAAPASGAVAGQNGSDYAMSVSWAAVTENSAALSGTCLSSSGATSSIDVPNDTALLDLQTYRVHRERSTGSNAAFGTSAANRIDDDWGNASPGTTAAFVDARAAACESYYYRALAVDACGVEGAPSPAMASAASFTPAAGVTPAAPMTLTANPAVTNNGVYYTVPLSWSAVSTASDGKPAAVARYVIKRERQLTGSFSYSLDTSFGSGGTREVLDATTFTDYAPMTVSGLIAKYRYTVKARWNCSTLRDSAFSPPHLVPCATTGTASISSPTLGATITIGAVQPIVVSVTGTWNRADVFVKNEGGATVASFSNPVAVTNGNFTFNWDTSSLADGDYTIEAVLYQGSCTRQLTSVTVNLDPVVACFTVAESSFQGSNRSMVFTIKNNCTSTQTITAITPSWCCGPNNATTQLQKIRYDGMDVYLASLDGSTGGPPTGSSGHQCALLSVITLAPGATSSQISLDFSEEMKAAGGLPKSKLDPILLHTSDLPAGEDGGPVSPP
jgi:hypothetical protein